MNSGERLTEKQAEALRVELAELEGPRRENVVQAIKTAREFGDLSENFEYHAAKNEQGLLEARIRTLRSRLDLAQIVPDAGSDEVGIGSVVDQMTGLPHPTVDQVRTSVIEVLERATQQETEGFARRGDRSRRRR